MQMVVVDLLYRFHADPSAPLQAIQVCLNILTFIKINKTMKMLRKILQLIWLWKLLIHLSEEKTGSSTQYFYD